jgi:hypothetical protein
MRKSILAILAVLVSASLSAQIGALPLSSHTVKLTCTASTSACVVGYYFYRGSAPGGESPTPLNSSAVTPCVYTDATVNASTTYYYRAKAYCSVEGYSNFSNEATATTPADTSQPQPPGALKVGTITRTPQ